MAGNTAPKGTNDKGNNSVRIGAAVGGVLGGLFLTAGIALLLRWQKKRHDQIVADLQKQKQDEKPAGNDYYAYNGNFGSPVQVEGSLAPYEADSRARHEAGLGVVHYEMPTQGKVHELQEKRRMLSSC
ncbi:hypothetical protein CC80DRAFT_547477 [Byssothecium circinans]|uniref:Uncharacterized protein n=1 Tax=Byssothecium circinans TaxID=147558 RepID=A0A6A5TZT3_9PLEO|nr:hypothetical protein CC80DRAFT_547477 [Byssothecium circinans]